MSYTESFSAGASSNLCSKIRKCFNFYSYPLHLPGSRLLLVLWRPHLWQTSTMNPTLGTKAAQATSSCLLPLHPAHHLHAISCQVPQDIFGLRLSHGLIFHISPIYTHTFIYFILPPCLILPCSRAKQIKVWNQLNLCQITSVVVCLPRNVSHHQTIWCYTMHRQKLIFWVMEVASVWLQSAWVPPPDLGHWDWHLFLKW